MFEKIHFGQILKLKPGKESFFISYIVLLRCTIIVLTCTIKSSLISQAASKD